MSTLTVSIYPCSGHSCSSEADLVIVPGLNGDIGIVGGDRILTYILKPGVIYLIKDNNIFKRLFIFNGRFLAQNDRVAITTEYEIIDLEAISLEEIDDRIKLVQHKRDTARDGSDKNYYELRLQQENLLRLMYKDKNY